MESCIISFHHPTNCAKKQESSAGQFIVFLEGRPLQPPWFAPCPFSFPRPARHLLFQVRKQARLENDCVHETSKCLCTWCSHTYIYIRSSTAKSIFLQKLMQLNNPSWSESARLTRKPRVQRALFWKYVLKDLYFLKNENSNRFFLISKCTNDQKSARLTRGLRVKRAWIWIGWAMMLIRTGPFCQMF